jgi:hypothetical protein
MRASLVDGFQTGRARLALTALQEFRATLVARMQAPPAPTRVTAPPSALMCQPRQLACGRACVELATDVRNCGSCGSDLPRRQRVFGEDGATPFSPTTSSRPSSTTLAGAPSGPPCSSREASSPPVPQILRPGGAQQQPPGRAGPRPERVAARPRTPRTASS